MGAPRWRASWLTVASLFVMVACGSGALVIDQSVAAPSDVTLSESSVAPPVFPWWETTLDEGDGGEAVGTLRFDGRCVYLDSFSQNSLLLVLPHPQTTIDFDIGMISLGDVEVSDGDRVIAGGGSGASRPEEDWPDCDPVDRFFVNSLDESLIDGILDCDIDEGGLTIEAEIDAEAEGRPAREALEAALLTYANPDGGVFFISDTEASVVVRRRELVIGRAERVGSGGFVVSSLTGCEGRQ